MKYIFDSDAVTSAISEWGISEDGNDISGVKLIWVLDEDGMVQCEDSSYDYYWTKRYGKKELLICKKGVFFDRVCYSKDNYGLSIIVFNKRNEYIADSVVIDKNGIMR